MAERAQLAVLSVEVHLPESRSLKDKRRILKSIKDRVRAKFNVSVAEIDQNDKWQLAVLGFCQIGNDKSHLDSTLQHIVRLLESVHDIQVLKHQFDFL